VASAAVSDPILRVDSLVKRFGGLKAVDGASVSVERGSITAVIGPNGAGKTTLFNLVTGFIRPDGGVIELDGRSIYRHAPYQIARCGMMRTFQLPKVLGAMTVLENMLLGGAANPGERLLGLACHPIRWRRRERELRADALELLERFRLDKHASAYAATLSGGQRKLLEMARLLMSRPRLILLDEPLAGVHPVLGQQLIEHMHALRAERGTTFLFIEHDMETVMTNADAIVVMAQGRVIAAGTPAVVRQERKVIDAYLGSNAEDAS